MDTNEKVKDIIKSSIDHVICIDDEFSLPYEREKKGTNFELTKKIYESLTKTYNCMVDIVRYEESKGMEQYVSKLERKDLAVVDWELGKSGTKYQDTLECLENILDTDIPFICIYTNEPDNQKIYNQIYFYFSGLMNENKQIMQELYENYAMEEDEELRQLKDEIITWSEMCVPTKEKNEIIEKVAQLITEWKKDGIDIYKEIKTNDVKNFIYLYTIMMKEYVLPKIQNKNVSVVKIPDIKKNIGALNINGKVLMVFYKRRQEAEVGVYPDELLERYACYLAEEPNNLFNIVWLHYKNKLNRIVFKQGEFFQDISQEAFLYHKKVLDKEGESLDNFIKMLYQDELISKLKLADDLNEQSITSILDSGKKKKVTDNDLANLNSYYSINQNDYMKNNVITFGDIFKGKDAYYLCITALCDCLNAKEKIKSNYCFVEGYGVANEDALSNAEKGFYSFIKGNNSNKCISVCWDTHKLLTLHIPMDKSNKNEINVRVRDKDIKLQYVCNQKQNYTQRIANDTFSWANRVGVTYAKLEETRNNDLAKEIAATMNK